MKTVICREMRGGPEAIVPVACRARGGRISPIDEQFLTHAYASSLTSTSPSNSRASPDSGSPKDTMTS